MQFLYQPLTWGFLLVLLPLLIHLINLMRQHRVQWAAMEFLLQSYKKHRRWIWLKQFLLLLLRMLVVATVVAMLAGLVTQQQLALLGGQSTHHFILLDDSLSMNDRGSDGTALDQGLQALRRIASQLSQQTGDHKVTLLRFSQTLDARQTRPDLNAVTVDSDFAELMEQTKRDFQTLELDIQPAGVLEVAERLVGLAAEQRTVLYVISDYRADVWESASELKGTLQRIRQTDCEVHLVRCVEQQRANLGIVKLQPAVGTLAAGVPMLLDVTVQNFGPTDSQQVSIRVTADSFPQGMVLSGDETVTAGTATTVVIDELAAGEQTVRQVQLKFDQPGQHIVHASLARDALVDDNVRHCLVDVPATLPVLMIDGTGQEEDSYYLRSIFRPAERVVTGIEPVVRDATYLRDVADAELARYASVYLLDVERLSPKAVSALERYVETGGGLGIFVGPNSDPSFLNSFYEQGSGLFPLPVQGPRDAARVVGDGPQLRVNDHPIFRVLVDEGGQNRPLTGRIRVQRYLPPDPDWERTPDVANAASPQASTETGTSTESSAGTSTQASNKTEPDKLASRVQILAQLANNDPLVLAHDFGRGRVATFLTTASPNWNNWALGPSYPVVILQLHSFLAQGKQSFQAQTVGEAWTLKLASSEYVDAADFQLPAERSPSLSVDQSTAPSSNPIDGTPDNSASEGNSGDTPTSETAGLSRHLQRQAIALSGSEAGMMEFQLGQSSNAMNPETLRSGTYVASLTTLDGQPQQRRQVYNVSTTDSDLALIPPAELATQLEDLQIQIHASDELIYDVRSQAGFSWSHTLLGLLVAMLLIEQLLAYSASYHVQGGTA